MSLFDILITASAALFVLFLPGLSWSFVLFDKEQIDILERIAISFGLSMGMLPISILSLNLAGLTINVVNVSIVLAVLTAVPVAFILVRVKVEDLRRRPGLLPK